MFNSFNFPKTPVDASSTAVVLISATPESMH